MKKIRIKDNIEIKISENRIDYIGSLNFMERRVSNILLNKEKELIWFLNHDHIYTMGTSSEKKEILSKINIPLLKTNRGGKTTYHGPGQRIIYFLINLNNRKKDIRKFVNLIENSTIQVLNELSITATTYSDRIGIWITKTNNFTLAKEQKIAAIGLRIKKWITYHGLSFNLDPDLNYYKNIDACGLKNYSSTSIKDLGMNLTQDEFDKLYLKFFLKGLKNL
jgi:lipoyl(octanoyl) transferase